MRDELFKAPLTQVAGFEFNDDTADVFDDMIHRSIPFYQEVQRMIMDYAGQFYQPRSAVYDLGCSTGSLIAAMAARLPHIDRIVGVDNSEPMIRKTRERLARLELKPTIELACEDLRETPIENASVVVMGYTLQFIRPLYRVKMVRRIFEGLHPGGILLLSEKVLEDSTSISQSFVDMYYRFKRRNGYSEMEISQKRERLENVLIPYKIGEQRELLAEGGFEQAEIFFKWNNFASFIAIKPLE